MKEIDLKKKNQRKIASKKRLKIYQSIKNVDLLFCKNFYKSKFYVKSNIIASFLSIKSEITTEFLNKFILESKKKLCLPTIQDNRESLLFKEYNLKTKLVIGRYGILEPVDTNTCLPDIILVPCLAFDSCGNRLGYGGGYYDKTISYLKSIKHSFLTVALAYDDQKIKNVVHNHLDQKLNYILTEKQLYKFL
jgi:5-formyltetrahydrofolate cyclo-ligase